MKNFTVGGHYNMRNCFNHHSLRKVGNHVSVLSTGKQGFIKTEGTYLEDPMTLGLV